MFSMQKYFFHTAFSSNKISEQKFVRKYKDKFIQVIDPENRPDYLYILSRFHPEYAGIHKELK